MTKPIAPVDPGTSPPVNKQINWAEAGQSILLSVVHKKDLDKAGRLFNDALNHLGYYKSGSPDLRRIENLISDLEQLLNLDRKGIKKILLEFYPKAEVKVDPVKEPPNNPPNNNGSAPGEKLPRDVVIRVPIEKVKFGW